MSILLLFPILLPIGAIILLLFFRGKINAQRIIGLFGSTLQLIFSIYILFVVQTRGIQVIQIGNWPAPYGITLVVDLFSAIMLILSGLVGLMISIYAIPTLEKRLQSQNFFPLLQALLLGVNGAFLTGDVFNLYVWFEVMILSSFVLLTLGGKSKQLDGAIKYVSMNLISSMLFLAGIGLLYGKTGTLNMADLALKIRESDSSILINSSAMLFFLAFSIKSALFPFFFWLPASYHTPPIAVTALFAGLLTKVGIYAMIRFYTLFFVQNPEFWHTLLLIIAATTMVVGVLTAVSQYDVRKILSFHIVSQVGYMVMGLGLFSVLGLAGAIFYMMHHIIAKTNMFLISGVIHKIKGTYQLKAIGGLYKNYPFLTLLFLIASMGLAGVPPLSGFVGKLLLIMAGFETEHYLVTTVAISVGLITLFSMVKIWNEAFWKKQPGDRIAPKVDIPFGMMAPVVTMALGTVIIGIAAEPFIQLATEAALQLLNPEDYINAVLKP